MGPVLVHAVVLGLAAAVATGLGVYALRAGRAPGRVLFSLFMLSVSVWAAAYAAGLPIRSPGLRIPLEMVAWFGRATTPVWILLFALAYTGYDGLVTRRTVAGLLVLPATILGLVWTHPWNDLMWATSPRVVVTDGMALVVAGVGPLYWVNVVYAYALILVTTVLVVRLVLLSERLYSAQSMLLLAGIAAPTVANALTVLPPHPIPGFDYTPYGFVVTGLAFGYSLSRRRLLDIVPATRQLGRDAAIRQLEEGMLVVDTDTRVIYCNPTAAEMLGCSPSGTIGTPVRSFVDESALDFEPEDALAEWEREDGVYEVRTSPIRDRHSRLIGHTLLIRDITARKRHERRLARQRDELGRLDDLNALIRGVNRALVSATDRADIERAVCERLVDSDPFRTACAADVPTWNGTADRWTVASASGDEAALPNDLDTEELGLDESDGAVVTVDDADDQGSWTVIPITYGQTVYGALGLRSRHDRIADDGINSREREVLAELGELVGHAINAVENRQLLAAETVVELELHSRDRTAPLVRATGATDCELELTGLVPNGGESHLAYLRITDGDGDAFVDALTGGSGSGVSVAREGDSVTMLEWGVPDESLFGTLVDQGANVLEATATDGAVECVVEVASDIDARALVGRMREAFPDTRLVAKRERERPARRVDTPPVDAAVEELTDRQREALEVAYRAGYFEWPRENTAEDVAETLDVTPPTVHYHLRRAEGAMLDAVFDGERSE